MRGRWARLRRIDPRRPLSQLQRRVGVSEHTIRRAWRRPLKGVAWGRSRGRTAAVIRARTKHRFPPIYGSNGREYIGLMMRSIDSEGGRYVRARWGEVLRRGRPRPFLGCEPRERGAGSGAVREGLDRELNRP